MKHHILMVGNFVRNSQMAMSVCEELALGLESKDYFITRVSAKGNKLSRLWDMTWTVFKLRNQYELAHIDVFSGPSFFVTALLCGLLRLCKKKYLLTLHGGNLPNFSRKYPKLMGQVLGNAVVVLTPSKYLFEQMHAYSDRLQVLPNPFDLSKYSFIERKKPKAQLMWLRAFHSIYNPLLAIESAQKLCAERPDLRLRMIGPDKGDGTLIKVRAAILEKKLESVIHIEGLIGKEEVPKVLNSADILINTTQIDNTPVSVIEAMACGLCIVSTDVGGIPYLLDHEVDALLVPPNDPEAMANAINRILNDSNLAAKLSRNARKKAEQFDTKTVLSKWDQLLRDILKNIKETV